MMTAELVSTFKASDGRPFEVRWGSEANAQESWHWNDSHNPRPITPLYAWVMRQDTGRLRAYADAGIDPPPMFRGFEVQNGFQYTRQSPLRGEELQQFIAKSRAMAARFGGPGNVFEQFCLPRIRQACERLQKAPAETSASELAETYQYSFHLTHVAGQGMFVPVSGRLASLLAGHFAPPEIPLLVQEAGQGANNATVDSDRAIARMAKLAHANPTIARAIEGPTADMLAAIEAAPGAAEFRSELAEYLEEYGWRCRDWDIFSPTLRERPELVIEMVRQSMRNPKDPDELRAGALAVRAGAIRRIESALKDDPEALRAARECTDALENYIAVREGRALWQLIGAGSLRGAFLRKGEALVQAGTIDTATDIFFLEPDEFEGTANSGGLRGVIESRKAERASWEGVIPPRVISANPDMLEHGGAGDGAKDVLRGLPASRGTVTAKARVIIELDDSETMEAGEVLVCVMTSPPWTPIIGMASALVTNSGMALSHSAIAAREYGIPCVVGTGDATVRIRTGDTLTVDGDAGTVLIQR